MTRTIAFVAVAAASVGIAAATHWSYQPADPLANVPIGQPFYPDFDNPNEATGLRVATYDSDAARTNVFSVENKNGLWRIPSHHNYPADGESRLAKTAASFVGVTRKAFVEASEAAYKRYRLLDPLDESVSGTEGRGDRITLFKGEQPLVDIIVGNKLEGEEGTYYVRRADEKAIYTADLGNLEFSTKFADWIEPDLLDVNRNDIRELIVDKYHIDETRGVVVQGEKNVLHRESATADWQLDGLNPEQEKVKQSEIGSALFALDDLKIVGVRPKPAGLSAELKTQEGMALTAADLIDLQDKGFFVDQRQGRLLSNEGEVIVGTDQGALYVLRFGEEFSGSDVEVEVGSKKAEKNETKAEGDKKDGTAAGGGDNAKAETTDAADAGDDGPAKEGPKQDEGKTESDEKPADAAAKKSRYVFITAQFDEELVGPKPTSPVKPEPPAEQPKSEEPKPDQPKTDDNQRKDAGKAEDSAAKHEAKPDNAPPESKPDPQKEYEKALEDYKLKQEVFETQLKDYQQKVADGKKKVDELNARFADWYYVISADVFDKLRLKRDSIVEKVEKKDEEKQTPGTEAAPGADTSTPAAGATVPDGKTTTPPADTPETGEKKPAPPAPLLPGAGPGDKKPEATEGEKQPEASDEKPAEEADRPKSSAGTPAESSTEKDGAPAPAEKEAEK